MPRKKMDDLNKLKDRLSALAIDIATGFDLELDYSPASIKKVEKILGTVHREYKRTKNDDGLHGIAIEFAAYIIKVIEANFAAGTWKRDHTLIGPDSFPYDWNGHELFPYGWCLKRILDGPGDNVWVKFNALVMARNKGDV